jgi:hypothetical protein
LKKEFLKLSFLALQNQAAVRLFACFDRNWQKQQNDLQAF